ncbi:MAG: helix-turn-helix domain-containing protein [Rhizobiales bacterium]|nr:helix-turn-helix domain-containing protein [Hyphomicrobiales bacterium]
MLAIGILSKRTGVNIETIRYYERIGLLPIAQRSENGRRFYRDEDTRRLKFVRHSRELGFDLAAIRSLLALQETPDASCAQVTSIAQAQLTTVEERLRRLSALRDELARITAECAGGRVAECRIIETLETGA